ncbi:YheC/YheD family protein [Paenibacillus sp. N1-5-1-14]|uniref:YheC/YheD family protein n=1 Tax=Paenibacillus radicibacter TaxID=2972488 RepID=UPI002159407A|nr:YheC/YheD family protein [Paenibacillus radicibacter]MCR8643472.1 YheC/YheD family protein [Paenibacillus radicibacter]
MKYKSSSLKNKWTKTKWLLEQPRLRKHVPRTMLFNRKNLQSMLSAHRMIYFKPADGSGGAKIIRIKRLASRYRIQYKTKKSYYLTLDALHQKLQRFAGSRSFLLQKGIRLARTNGKPFDIRVMVQKTNRGNWVSSAIFTKIGERNKVTTNYNQGGAIGYFNETMAGAGYDTLKIQQLEQQLKQLGVAVGNNFEHHVEGFRELGLDVAIGPKGKPWILEVNTSPRFYPLKHMADKKLYQRIIFYAKQYGRYS